nr:MAG TPA: hypothetical protein [Caudoviricetes sp.]
MRTVGLKSARSAYAANPAKPHEYKKNRGARIVPRFSRLARKEGFEPSRKSPMPPVILWYLLFRL